MSSSGAARLEPPSHDSLRDVCLEHADLVRVVLRLDPDSAPKVHAAYTQPVNMLIRCGAVWWACRVCVYVCACVLPVCDASVWVSGGRLRGGVTACAQPYCLLWGPCQAQKDGVGCGGSTRQGHGMVGLSEEPCIPYLPAVTCVATVVVFTHCHGRGYLLPLSGVLAAI